MAQRASTEACVLREVSWCMIEYMDDKQPV